MGGSCSWRMEWSGRSHLETLYNKCCFGSIFKIPINSTFYPVFNSVEHCDQPLYLNTYRVKSQNVQTNKLLCYTCIS